ncbi:MAG: hypothetical protein ACOX2M_05690 [Fastidiosipilaceae bacterium]
MSLTAQAESGYSIKSIMKFAGAFLAWLIGSGFATGQEMLQFFSAYGCRSYAVLLVNLIGFTLLAQVMLLTGFDHRDDSSFNHFKHFSGDRVGAFYTWLIPISLVLIMSVLVSGAGATMAEYYGINHHVGSASMALLVLTAYLVGFERLVKVVSKIGPLVILFSLVIGTITVVRDAGKFSEISEHTIILNELRAAPHWSISSVLYISLNFLSGGGYFVALGGTAINRKDAKYGALLGALIFVLAVAVINSAILLNADHTVSAAIPMLFLARRISYVLGAVFSLVLILGMFSSCSAMMWSVCSRFKAGGSRGNRLFAVLVALIIFVLGLFSFDELIGFFYPLEGYIGLVFVGGAAVKGVRQFLRDRKRRASEFVEDDGV